MERVQFQQEQMLAELKDLVQKGVFTAKETKEIMKKRTGFEIVLVRRVAKKADFLRYAAYEMGLEQLRRKRVERLKLPQSPPSISDYALVKRQYQIFERALKRFKADIGLWLEYIQAAQREGARALVGRISARALQLHPNEPALYILSAAQEMKNNSLSTARTLLQRGLRLNSDSVDLWKEYVKMELGFIESMRRRWEVLKIDRGEGKGKEKAPEFEKVSDDEEANAEKQDVDEEDEVARKEIMDGAIIKSVISSAAKAIPKLPLFSALLEIISSHPSPPILRHNLAAYLYEKVQESLPDDPRAIRLVACRGLAAANLRGTALIEGLRTANIELMDAARDRGNEEMNKVYAQFVEEWWLRLADEDLREYLVGSLKRFIREKANESSPSLVSTHIKLLRSKAREKNTSEGEEEDAARVG